jgi:predicted dienelactone hydrolase
MGVWYPTTDSEAQIQYLSDIAGSAARNGAAATCARFPLVVFSHGFGGCGTQSVFFTEQLARRGYVVAAPDHRDALCSVDGNSSFRPIQTDQSLFNPERWDATTEIDRRDDLEAAINWALGADLAGEVDSGRIGVAGHSLGGYAAISLAGAWPEWKDGRVRAALLFSPYILPFVVQNRSVGVDVPVMFHGGTLDFLITPFIKGDHGAYATSRPPKYYVELRNATHFEWSNMVCQGTATVASCLSSKTNASLIDQYGIAFLDAALKGNSGSLAGLNGSGLSDYQHDGSI